MAKVVARPDESLDAMLRRFKKQVIASEVLLECRKREFFKRKLLSVKRNLN